MGIEVYLLRREGEDKHFIAQPSELYPKHVFQVGYWCSSYNNYGINRVLRRVLNTDLYELFFDKSWEEIRENASRTIELLKQEKYDVLEFYNPSDNEIQITDIIKVYKNTINDVREREFSTRTAHYFEGLTVLAIFPGQDSVRVVVPSDFEYIIQSLEIIKETADFVISRPGRENYELYWKD